MIHRQLQLCALHKVALQYRELYTIKNNPNTTVRQWPCLQDTSNGTKQPSMADSYTKSHLDGSTHPCHNPH
jgi:hypothetical protein